MELGTRYKDRLIRSRRGRGMPNSVRTCER